MGSLPLSRLSNTSRLVSAERSRRRKTALLAELLAEVTGDDIALIAAYLAGELPQGRIGLGPALLREVHESGSPEAEGLSLREVNAAFDELGAIAGAGAKVRKRERLETLFRTHAPEDVEFLKRLILGELRQGAVQGVLLEAVAEASGAAASRVRRAAMLGGSLREVATAVLEEGEAALARFQLEVQRPVLPMLAGSVEKAAEAIEKLGRCALEAKLDGVRVQVHRKGDEVRIFTRQLHDVTAAVPELVEHALTLPGEPFVLDGEALSFDSKGTPRPFQETMRRFGRKLDVDRERELVPLTPVYFDLLMRDGEAWIDRPAFERSQALLQLLGEKHSAPRRIVDSAAEAETFYGEVLELGHEGLMAKDLEAAYEAGRRGSRWLKLKPTHTLDLVVLAAEWGSGRRTGKLSNLHLGARDGAGGFTMLGKTFKGMTDAVLAEQTERLLAIETHREDHVVHVRPERVVEIAFDGVQRSPQYPSGLALRFARLVAYRDDRTADSASELGEVRRLLAGD